MSYMNEINSYGIDLSYISEASPFELIGTLVKRDELEKVRNFMTDEEAKRLELYDDELLAKAQEFYNVIKGVYKFQNRQQPSHWWANIDLVASGKLLVDTKKKAQLSIA